MELLIDINENLTVITSPTTLTTDDSSRGCRGMSVSAQISETAVRNVYILIGVLGLVGNLLVVVILTCYTNVTEKVSRFASNSSGNFERFCQMLAAFSWV